MNDGKLYIIISDRPDAAGTGALDLEGSSPTNAKDKSGMDYASHRFFNFMEAQAKKFVMYNVNNIGNFTGNYVAQRRVNEVVELVNILSNIGMATLAGAKYGPAGVVVGAAIAVAGTAINAGYETFSQRLENAKTNYNIEQLKRKSGLNIYMDGSRGTEN